MRTTSLENKTIRPGLNSYSFYRSDRHPASRREFKPAKTKRGPGPVTYFLSRFFIIALVVAGAFIGYHTASSSSTTTSSTPSPTKKSSTATTPAVSQQPTEQNVCIDNTETKLVIVSISQRHAWACHDKQLAYDMPVITGMEIHDSTRTPVGSYRIYAKHTDTVLKGSDEAGSWSDPVSYWMPFLDNQYGTYGFHDATWRPGDPFGKVDPNSTDASHGCVELPLQASKWLYQWATVGTLVRVDA